MNYIQEELFSLRNKGRNHLPLHDLGYEQGTHRHRSDNPIMPYVIKTFTYTINSLYFRPKTRRTNYRISAIPLDPPIYRTIAIGYLKKDALLAASRRFIELLKAKADTLSD
jgi:hypothetical protein